MSHTLKKLTHLCLAAVLGGTLLVSSGCTLVGAGVGAAAGASLTPYHPQQGAFFGAILGALTGAAIDSDRHHYNHRYRHHRYRHHRYRRHAYHDVYVSGYSGYCD